jgi:hypothetical protein
VVVNVRTSLLDAVTIVETCLGFIPRDVVSFEKLWLVVFIPFEEEFGHIGALSSQLGKVNIALSSKAIQL